MKFFLAISTLFVGIYLSRKKINITLMRFFRDLSRSKARRRLHRNDAALVPMIFGKDKPISVEELLKDIKDDSFTMTLSQLSEMNGRNGNPTYISMNGLIYDVSANPTYGPGKQYHFLIGKDATKALQTGCLSEACIEESQISPEDAAAEVARWLELYHNHDLYKYVGRLVSDPVEDAIAKDTREEALLHAEGDLSSSMDRFHTYVAKGKDSYALEEFKDTLFLWQSALDALADTPSSPELTLRRAELLTRMVAVALRISDSDRAMGYVKQALASLEQSLDAIGAGPHPFLGPLTARLARTLALRASLLSGDEKMEEASASFSQSLEVFRSALQHAGVGPSVSQAKTQAAQPNNVAWKASKAEVAELWSALASSQMNMGIVLMHLSRYEDAKLLFQSLVGQVADGQASTATFEEVETMVYPDVSPKAVVVNALSILEAVRTQATEYASQCADLVQQRADMENKLKQMPLQEQMPSSSEDEQTIDEQSAVEAVEVEAEL